MNRSTKLDIVEFAEKECGVTLLNWQKELLRTLRDNPDNKLFLTIPPRSGKSIARRLCLEYEKMTKGE